MPYHDEQGNLQVYIGQTRSGRLIVRLADMGFGEMTVRGELPPRRTPWAFDNGAYRDYTAGKPFNADAFCADLAKIPSLPMPPLFIVCPDLVAGGETSLDISLSWGPRLRSAVPGVPIYLAVQDGMPMARVRGDISLFDGIFVGGTLEWKIKTGADWVQLAHLSGRPCHIGRAGAINTVQWAKRIGADSIDSCTPLWAEENLQRFLWALNNKQQEIF